MRRFLTLIFILPIYSYSQTAVISDYKLNSVLAKDTNIRIKYPVIKTNNIKIDNAINKSIKDSLTTFDMSLADKPVNVVIDSLLKYGLNDLNYDVNYNSNGILSLTINSESCGAYCSGGSIYLNYDLTNGKKIILDSLFIPNYLYAFTKRVVIERASQIEKHKKYLKSELEKKSISRNEYDWAIESINSCPDPIIINDFTLNKDYIEIFSPCSFPHAILSLEPGIELKYKWSELKDKIDKRYKTKLIK